MIRIDETKCTLCGECVDVCPMEALDTTRGYLHLDEGRCISCHICVPTCPEKALSITRR
ncbi:MAG TPA: 4Fe-4S binding protein [Tissierellia bacterium]|nr:4Fe-4S binding protein [Tissierellia bacterium]